MSFGNAWKKSMRQWTPKQFQLMSRFDKQYSTGGMSFARATSEAEWRGQEYYHGKKLLAQRLVLQENVRKAKENMRKAFEFMQTVLAHVLWLYSCICYFPPAIYIIHASWTWRKQ
jgi:hypothetical protein